MQLNFFNYRYRKFNGSSKSRVRVPVTALKVGNFKSLLSYNTSNSQSSFDTCSTPNLINVRIRSFRNKYACKNFINDISKRFYRRYKQPVLSKIALSGRRLVYYFNSNKIKKNNSKLGRHIKSLKYTGQGLRSINKKTLQGIYEQ